jgi:P-type E1-E2 ATPase
LPVLPFRREHWACADPLARRTASAVNLRGAAMLAIAIPGFRQLELQHLVLDYNGTLAIDGILIPGVREVLGALAQQIEIHVVTADTFGCARSELSGLPVKLSILPLESQAEAKLAYVQKLGVDHVCAIGNGRNDHRMLAAAAVGIALVQREGGAGEALANATVVSTDILDALDLLRRPARLIATLRS